MSMKRFWKWYYIVPAVIVLAPIGIALIVTIAGGIVMYLWNWLLPPLFGWPQITLLLGFGLVALCRFLFGGWGGGGGNHPKHIAEDQARQKMRERWACEPAGLPRRSPEGEGGNVAGASAVNSEGDTR
jgi:hypothetical protein